MKDRHWLYHHVSVQLRLCEAEVSSEQAAAPPPRVQVSGVLELHLGSALTWILACILIISVSGGGHFIRMALIIITQKQKKKWYNLFSWKVENEMK